MDSHATLTLGRAWLLRGVTSSRRAVETAPRTGGPAESWMWLEVLSAANSVTSDRMSEDRLGTALETHSRGVGTSV